MPVFDGTDIPAVEWCSILEAQNWIAYKEAPVAPPYNRLPLSDRIEERDKDYDIWEEAKARLFHYLTMGRVAVRGKPAKCNGLSIHGTGSSLVIYGIDRYGNSCNCSDWGNIEIIPPAKIIVAGVQGFDEGGCIYFVDNPDPFGDEWAYSDIEVDFRQLMTKEPIPKGVNLRVGGQPIPTDQIEQSASTQTMPPLPLSLDEACYLLEYGNESSHPDELYPLAEEDGPLGWAGRQLVRALESSAISARGKLSTSRAHNYYANTAEEQEWEGHAHEWETIPAGAWEEWGVNVERSALKTRTGEYIEIRIDRSEVLQLAALLNTDTTVPTLGPQMATRDGEGGADGDKSSKSGRKTEYPAEYLLALMAVVLEDKGIAPESDEEAISWLLSAYSAIHGKEPGRTTIQNKVIKPLNAARRAYAAALESENG